MSHVNLMDARLVSAVSVDVVVVRKEDEEEKRKNKERSWCCRGSVAREAAHV